MIQTLQKLREKIIAGWTQCTSARNSLGLPVEMDSPEACQFCIMGGLDAVTGDDYTVWKQALLFLNEALPTDFYGTVISYNDTPSRTKEEMVALVDRAIFLAKERGHE